MASCRKIVATRMFLVQHTVPRSAEVSVITERSKNQSQERNTKGSSQAIASILARSHPDQGEAKTREARVISSHTYSRYP